jgi:hypothetical protein
VSTDGITEDQLREAIDRVARTRDGRMLYLFLQRHMMGIPSDMSGGALRRNLGERIFASKLIGLMAKGIQDSGGRTEPSTGSSGSNEQPIVFAVPGARRLTDTGGAGRRVTADSRVPGWDRPEE